MGKFALYNKSTNDPLKERHNIVDKDDRVIGAARRIDFLKNKKMIRRACHVWLKMADGRFVFQQRSEKKDLQPLYWNAAATGFVKAGKRSQEEIKKEAERELHEEIGVKSKLKFVKKFLHRSREIGGIMVYWCIGKYGGKNCQNFKINKKEVKRVKAFTVEKILEKSRSGQIKLSNALVDELSIYLKEKNKFDRLFDQL